MRTADFCHNGDFILQVLKRSLVLDFLPVNDFDCKHGFFVALCVGVVNNSILAFAKRFVGQQQKPVGAAFVLGRLGKNDHFQLFSWIHLLN